jgi:glycosyltransferase involved in cell wall biosynthesis
MIKLHSDPQPANLAGRANGIAQVVYHLARLLPERGFEYVQDPKAAGLFVRHAGANSYGLSHVDVEHCHGLLPTGMPGPHQRWEWQVNAEVIANLVKARAITVPSQWVGDIIRRDMRVEPFVVPWGIDPSEWQQGRNDHYVLWAKGRSHGVNDPSPVQELAKRCLDYSFVVTFGTPGSNVRITGLLPFEKMKTVIAGAEVYLATTRETFGIQTLEAMASGVPVLGYRWAATPDLVYHKETGYLAEPGDLDDLQRGLYYCISNRRRLGAAARELALTYTWETVADNVASIYQGLMSSGSDEGPEVSIVIPCYNYGRFVTEAIQSALGQQGSKGLEVIVVDDASTDESWDSIIVFGDKILALHNSTNKGVAETRNFGASRAKGKFIAFLDADDVMQPGWLKATLTAIKTNDRLGLSYTKLLLRLPDNSTRVSEWPPAVEDVQTLISGGNSVPSCCLIRREAFDRAGGYSTRFEPTEDGELWTKIAECGYGVVCASPKPLLVYRVGHPSLSRGKSLPDYKSWHLPSGAGKPPFAAVPSTIGGSYPVRDYDRPVVAVIILHPAKHTEAQLRATLDIMLGQTYRYWAAGIYGKGPLPNMRAYPMFSRLEEPLDDLLAPLVFIVDSGDNILDARSIERALGHWQKTGEVGDVVPFKWIEEIEFRHTDTRKSMYRRLAKWLVHRVQEEEVLSTSV